MSSIRRRILLRVLGLLLLGSMLLNAVSYLDAAHEIEELFDAQLGISARVLQGLMRLPEAQLDHQGLAATLIEAAGTQPALGHRYESKLAYQVRDAKGQTIASSFNAPVLSVDDWTPGFASLQHQGMGWRRYVLSDSQQGMAIWVGEREDVRGELVGKIVRSTLLPDLLIIPVLLLLVWLAIGSGLRPLEHMAELIRERQPDSLAPLSIARLPDELEPMQAALNRLLAQLRQLLEREQRFIADAAHELRTPLAVLSIHADNARHSKDPAEQAQALAHLQSGVARATRLVSQLLTLARLGEGQEQPRQAINLLSTCRNELAELMPLALKKQQTLSFDVEGELPATLALEPGSLPMLIQNLVGNAIQHSPAASQIRLHLSQTDQQLHICVEDSGPGVSEAEHAQLLERFHSAGTQAGAGLGLSITQRIVERHAGQLRFGRSPLGGLRVDILLPVSQPS
ncbi:MAG: two-component sensor histidine kinase [Gammaproteobacteria bacterium HGW-Gammaproteobacteria-11]|nr:MAG: two-component sensor histidine kinase [Gammaproteobacteria bacterium HGW-Gammaproteobacteria-11]